MAIKVVKKEPPPFSSLTPAEHYYLYGRFSPEQYEEAIVLSRDRGRLADVHDILEDALKKIPARTSAILLAKNITPIVENIEALHSELQEALKILDTFL